jgi:insertion element IS1 protein InsB
MDHHTGQVLAYVFGTREDETFLQWQELLAPFGITHFYTDGWGAYRRHIASDTHTVGKQHTQKIECTHTTLRARIKRLVWKTIGFSKSIQMHDLVIGLFINRFAYGRAI